MQMTCLVLRWGNNAKEKNWLLCSYDLTIMYRNKTTREVGYSTAARRGYAIPTNTAGSAQVGRANYSRRNAPAAAFPACEMYSTEYSGTLLDGHGHSPVSPS